MSRRTTYVLAGILAVLLVGSYIVGQQQKTAQSQAPLPALTPWLNLTRSEISNITIVDTTSDQKLEIVRNEQNEWRLQSPTAGPADSQRVDSWLGQWQFLYAQRSLTPTVGLDEFGLAQPAMIITLTNRTGEATIVQVGKLAPTGLGYYARRVGQDDVAVLGTLVIDGARELVKTPPVPPPPTLGAPLGPEIIPTP